MSEKEPEAKVLPINDDVMKGIMIDGMRMAVGAQYTIIDGIINPPRSEKTVVVTRILIPSAMIPRLIEMLEKVQEAQKKVEIKTELEEVKVA